jgi:hypothetical protein
VATSNSKVEVVLAVDRTTKNTVRFAEVTEGDFAVEQLGQLYIPNHTLGALGFTGSENIKVTVEIA